MKNTISPQEALNVSCFLSHQQKECTRLIDLFFYQVLLAVEESNIVALEADFQPKDSLENNAIM